MNKMAHENRTIRSWLPRPGTLERIEILQKLKRCLERKGMTRQEVYEGLLQLASTPRVLVKRSCGYRRQRNRSDTREKTKHPDLSSVKEIIRGEKTSAPSDGLTVIDNDTTIDVTTKPSAPELLNERSPEQASSVLKEPRESITSIPNADGSRYGLVQNFDKRMSTEISIADSSVTDEDVEANSTKKLDLSDSNALVTSATSDVPTTPPSGSAIVADQPIRNGATSVASYREEMRKRPDGDINVVYSFNMYSGSGNKKRATAVDCYVKKLRLRRKFRQIFGNDLTLSELEEETDILERFVHKRRIKRMRTSLDSGVGLMDSNANDILVEGSDENRPNLSENRVSSPDGAGDAVLKLVMESFVPQVRKTTSASPEPLVPRSMPSLDLLPFSVSSSPWSPVPVAQLTPDSSTDAIEDVCIRNDHFSDEDSSDSGKLVILLSPIHSESRNTFTPTSLDIEMPFESDHQESTIPVTSTTDLPLVESVISSRFGELRSDETTKKPPCKMESFEIIIDERVNAVATIEESSDKFSTESMMQHGLQSETIDYAGTGRSNTDSAGMLNVRESIDEVATGKGTPEPNHVAAMARETRDRETEPKIDQEAERVSIVDDTESVRANVVQASNVSEISTPSPSTASIPKLRVLRPSELGSRWCPTPLAGIPTSTPGYSFIAPSLPAMSGLSKYCSENRSMPRVPLMSRQSTEVDVNRTPNPLDYRPQQTSVRPMSGLVAPVLSHFDSNSHTGAVISILKMLIELDSYVQQYKILYLRYDTSALQKKFQALSEQSLQALAWYGLYIGVADFRVAVAFLLREYYRIMPSADRGIFTTDIIMNLLSIKSLQSLTKLPSNQVETQYVSNATAAQFSLQPGLYPAVPALRYHAPVYASRRIPSAHNLAADQPFSSVESARPSVRPTTTIFTAQQLTTLHYQIAAYNYLLRRPSPLQRPGFNSASNRSTPRQRRAKKKRQAPPAKNTTVARSPNFLTEDNNSSLRVLLDERQDPTDVPRNISHDRVPPVVMSQSEDAILETHSNGDPPCSNDQLLPQDNDNAVLSIEDVLQTIGALAGRSNVCNTIHTGDNNDNGVANSPEKERTEKQIREPSNSPLDPTLIPETIEQPATETSHCEQTAIDEKICDASVSPLNDQVPVIIIDDNHGEDVIEGSTDEIKTTFSISDVKSIAKDVFNNMEETFDEAPVPREVTQETNDNVEVRDLTGDSADCLRCGKTSSVVCEQCYDAFYCSSECHEAHWTEHHYLTCTPLPDQILLRLRSGQSSSKDNLPLGYEYSV